MANSSLLVRSRRVARCRALLWSLGPGVWLFSAAHAADSATGFEFFEKKVRPVLVERCYECHSAEAKKIKGGLLLDSQAGWSKGGDSGPAIVPGDVEKSLFIKAVRWLDEATQMPPKNKLPQPEIDALVEWVKMGAPDPRSGAASLVSATVESPLSKTNHWSYQPVAKPSVPGISESVISRSVVSKQSGGATPAAGTASANTDPLITDLLVTDYSSPIDAFILAKLNEQNLGFSPPTDPAILCRRLCFDLTGLPPTPEELESFVQSAIVHPRTAIASLVDRLLASPQFGEHWARHWFDVVRYAESVTLRGFIFKEAWRYRDYMIDSFNRDVPFDQLIREHIAGDLLPHRNVDDHRRQMIAATFLAVGNWNLEEQDKKQLDMDVVDEQLDTIGKAFLGQTIGCARCHDHKFDPVSTRDYYAMAGILKNSRTLKHANVSEWLEVSLPVEEQQEKILKEHELAVAVLQNEIKAAKEVAKAMAGKSAESKADAKPAIISANDLAGVVVDSTKAKAVGEWKHSTYSKHYIGDGYLHDLDQAKGVKTLSFAPELTRPGLYEVRLAYIHAPSRAANVPVTVFHADGETMVQVNQQEAPVIDGRFVSLGHFRFEANGFANVLVGNEGTKGFVTADAVQFVPQDSVAGDTRGSASKPDSRPSNTNSSRSQLTSASTNQLPDLKALEARLKKLQETGPKRPMVMGVQEAEKPEDIPIHVRGSVHNLGAMVPRGFLAVAAHGKPPAMPENESGRRELAAWIASTENPLTARVLVNRVWLWLMGEGLVRTPDNFGTTGEAPSHPALLDHLASRFVAEGWSLKKLVREIILSRTYQLSSKPIGKAATLDPENRLVSHAHRRRLTAEQLRDAMLAISGQLQFDGGGQTYPANRTADFGFVFSEARRSVYAPVFRNALPEIFEAFDFAPTSMVTGRRNVSTVPTQALFLLNHPFVREQAQAAAKRLLAMNLSDDLKRIDYAYRLSLGRLPSGSERKLAQRHLAETHRRSASEEAWTEMFHALFASADFRYLD